MKSTVTPIDHEVELSDNEFIVSKTDTKGIITYVNRTFMSIAGFSEPELLAIQHNIIRHPDMPRGVFKFLWDTLASGNEFFGYVKNLCKDGSFYWVFANVTPDYDPKGQLRGYYSVRRKPTKRAISIIEPIYQQMLQIEQKSSTKDAMNQSIAFLTATLEAQQLEYQHFVLGLDSGEDDE